MSTKPETQVERAEDVCQGCGGSGTVTLMTGHLGPDDYNYDADCEACHGTGSADIRDAINAIPYQPHTVKTGLQMVDRAQVLRIIEVRAALLEADGKAGGEAVYLVATGEVYEGQETYTRHDVRPPLCDAETLYTRHQPAAQVAQPLTDEDIEEVRLNTMPNAWLGEIDAFTAGVRFAERRHGIGKDQS